MHNEENYLEDVLKKHFQKNIKLTINGEEFKNGIFLLYRILVYSNNYFVEFTIKREKKNDSIKIPYPFKIEQHDKDNLLYFDYRVSSLCRKNKDLISNIRKVEDLFPESRDNKFYDSILEIQFS